MGSHRTGHRSGQDRYRKVSETVTFRIHKWTSVTAKVSSKPQRKIVIREPPVISSLPGAVRAGGPKAPFAFRQRNTVMTKKYESKPWVTTGYGGVTTVDVNAMLRDPDVKKMLRQFVKTANETWARVPKDRRLR